jgi:hypothetical protein
MPFKESLYFWSPLQSYAKGMIFFLGPSVTTKTTYIKVDLGIGKSKKIKKIMWSAIILMPFNSECRRGLQPWTPIPSYTDSVNTT